MQSPVTDDTTPPSLHELGRRYLAAQLSGNRREALRLLVEEGIQKGFTASQLRVDVIRWAQREIGALWEANKVSIAQEHIATAISQFALSHLYQLENAQPASGQKIVVACVEGEQHELPARLVADQLDVAGFEVRFVGADAPVDALLDLLKKERPQLVALSVSMSFNVPQLRETVGRIRAECPGLKILAGGRALTWAPQTAKELGLVEIDIDADVVAVVKDTLAS